MNDVMNQELDSVIRQVQEGNTQAYAFIVRNFQNQIFAYCWRLLGNRQEAEDAVQDILVKAFENIHMYKPKVSFSSWLYKVAYHHCLNLIRRKKLQQRFTFGLLQKDLTSRSAAQEVESRLFSEPLSKALAKLTLEERNLLVLRIFQEKPFAEIAEILDKKEENVKKKFARTKIKLKGMMIAWEEENQCVSYKHLMKTKV
ncbi:RNA polymerase sigma factor [Paenibacillus azoreducens]|uniref:RNA polymerase sigma factor n=2 Tax=Paenibacillus azoreducens TaxID=116718 RepID=A0A919YB71_9BACL|nr:sigma-70 family RNA polymerase sigma factor [Paenibacillus azoreducens]GIO47204.1 RNA polymerase sigma factor [Paenibacillus azoreducens]